MDILEISKECLKTSELVVSGLKEKGLKITAAESCTGGLVSCCITSVAGSSAVFDGALVSYANRIKAELLKVEGDVINTEGVVSSKCVAQMAKGAMRLFGADIAIAISGIAGPTGASKDKPVGTVYICVKGKNHTINKRYNFEGARDEVRSLSCLEALRLDLTVIEQE